MNVQQSWFRVDHAGARWGIAAVAAIVFVCGLFWQRADLLGGGAVVLCLVLRGVGRDETRQPAQSKRLSRRHADRAAEEREADFAGPAGDEEPGLPAAHSPRRAWPNSAPRNTDALVDEFLRTDRYCLLLRPEMKQRLKQDHVVRAVRALDEAMALVPAGRVLLGNLAEQSSATCGAIDVDRRTTERNLAEIETVYLDRYCVTNAQYQEFVDAGGYEQLEFWQEEALPALLDFVDQTGVPSPRYWHDGRFAEGEGRLPVAGVSWYEAAAFARWVGKRLPSDAEWTKAGAWPVESSPGRIAQRRYPWGESFDIRRANLYGSEEARMVPVQEFPSGVSVGGIHQLIGNVWEWTSTPLVDVGDRTLHVSESFMTIRGGAFDTYFENQATCHYQSGEHPLSRRANIGFRLALPMAVLEQREPDPTPQQAGTETETDTPAEATQLAESG